MANTLLLSIKNRMNSLSATEKKVASYILNHAELIPNMTTKELAEKSNVSEASVIRFSKTMGIDSFKTFKITLAQELAVSEEYITDFSIVKKKDSPYELFQKVTHVNKSAIESLSGSINKKELEQAIDVLKEARKIVFYGVGGSAIAAMDALYKFTKLGFQAEFSQDFHYMLSHIPYLNEKDVFVAISMSGQTKDVLDLSRFSQKKGSTLIAVTNINKSPLYKEADIRLATPHVEKDFRVGSITSRMTQLTIIDSLYISLFNSIGKEVVEQYQEAREEVMKLRR
ncbi:MurR/RpiR family transcriptional regulator [Virgibacillus alimentarius]|uniref:DNA-binding MurR/RpiR family transcriptional regulator n=1 Tax=Virgibacillus alimentarius TaxID=698769 RepID=A0ABS4S8M5_9BACI|nr:MULTISPECIES: MurR/RpiR family transcriptional regulator [Virgibacillus]MBP2257852.1 DNA-binding MurR/RpiR family transcriptional regulator [Virgibacillus alimentarius]HLR66576.1 MurR/RpiR family transcriptional regulator [Virgibacillus sp.]